MASAATIEIVYQVLGFVTAALAAWFGIRRQWPWIVNVASVFFVLHLFSRFVDWWWDWMPKYLFFLLVGLVAVALLLLLRRLREGRKGQQA